MRRVAVVLAAAALVLSACGDGSSHDDAGVGTTVAQDTPFACPDPHAEPADLVGHEGGVLPDGARAARLCLLDNRVPWTPPRGVLTSDVDALTRAVNAQRVYRPDPDTGCGGVGAPAWAMVFSYDDGTRTITGDNGGCWDLLVGATQRYGSKRVFAAFVQRVLSQRDGQSPARFRAGPPPCSRRAYRLGTFDPVADARTARTAALCLVRDGSPRRIPLTRHQLAVLRHDFATSGRRTVTGNAAYRCRTKNPTTYVVRGLDAWREPFTVDAQCGVYRILRPGETRYTFARLLPRSERMLTRLAQSWMLRP